MLTRPQPSSCSHSSRVRFFRTSHLAKQLAVLTAPWFRDALRYITHSTSSDLQGRAHASCNFCDRSDVGCRVLATTQHRCRIDLTRHHRPSVDHRRIDLALAQAGFRRFKNGYVKDEIERR